MNEMSTMCKELSLKLGTGYGEIIFDRIGAVFVTLRLPQPNQIISDLVDLFNTFLPDLRSHGLIRSYG